MVILVAGASHTGKTVLARRLLEQLHMPAFSIDHLKMGLIRSGNTNLTPEDDEKLTEYLWPIVREMIKTAIENQQDLIVEGCYIPFDWRKDFDGRYLPAIRFICLAFSEQYISANYDTIMAHASDLEKRVADIGQTPQLMKKDNRSVLEGFRRCGENVTLIEDDYDRTIRSLLNSFS